MRLKKLFNSSLTLVFATLMAGTLHSCIKPEAPNAEADILTCEIPAEIQTSAPMISNDRIQLHVFAWSDVRHLAPTFTLTEGATIQPASGTELDFSKPQKYTVTSEDGKWSKEYTVSVSKPDPNAQPVTSYSFEHVRYFESDGTQYYPIFIELNEDGTERMAWQSGNHGGVMLNVKEYYTTQVPEGYQGKGAKLTTQSTGIFGAMFGMPIAAGTLFIGEMDIPNMMSGATATHFGIPFFREPIMLEGFYKYKAGDELKDAQGNVLDGRDKMDVYAMLYEVTDKVSYLDGTNSTTSENIVLLARIKDQKETDEWTHFAIPFEPMNGKTIDEHKLNAGKYKLSIVISSSINGAVFEGAPGSTLYIDELKLYTKK